MKAANKNSKSKIRKPTKSSRLKKALSEIGKVSAYAGGVIGGFSLLSKGQKKYINESNRINVINILAKRDLKRLKAKLSNPARQIKAENLVRSLYRERIAQELKKDPGSKKIVPYLNSSKVSELGRKLNARVYLRANRFLANRYDIASALKQRSKGAMMMGAGGLLVGSLVAPALTKGVIKLKEPKKKSR